MAKIGRPSDYSEDMAAYICAEISSGRSLRSICADKGMPAPSTVFLWLARHQSFSEQYAKAQEDRTAAFAEDIIDIADDDETDVQRARLRVDARKWLMSKMAPKKYGDKQSVEHSGPDGGPVAISVIRRQIVDPDSTG